MSTNTESYTDSQRLGIIEDALENSLDNKRPYIWYHSEERGCYISRIPGSECIGNFRDAIDRLELEVAKYEEREPQPH